jgi:hypothetical protein
LQRILDYESVIYGDYIGRARWIVKGGMKLSEGWHFEEMI